VATVSSPQLAGTGTDATRSLRAAASATVAGAALLFVSKTRRRGAHLRRRPETASGSPRLGR
jgi:hypothetical protein